MKRYLLIVSAILLVLFNGVPARAETPQFDGTWKVTLTCESSFNSPGYTYNFVAQVKNSILLGQYGEENKPSSLKITGQIEPDGKSMLQATGQVGKIGPKGMAQGQTYDYTVEAQFIGSQGTGKRVSLRNNPRKCEFVFVKQ